MLLLLHWKFFRLTWQLTGTDLVVIISTKFIHIGIVLEMKEIECKAKQFWLIIIDTKIIHKLLILMSPKILDRAEACFDGLINLTWKDPTWQWKVKSDQNKPIGPT